MEVWEAGEPSRCSSTRRGRRTRSTCSRPKSPMTVLDRIRERARARCARIVLPEGTDPRVIEAAAILRRERLAEPVLVDDRLVAARRQKYGELLFERRKAKGMTRDEALAAAGSPLLFAALMVR